MIYCFLIRVLGRVRVLQEADFFPVFSSLSLLAQYLDSAALKPCVLVECGGLHELLENNFLIHLLFFLGGFWVCLLRVLPFENSPKSYRNNEILSLYGLQNHRKSVYFIKKLGSSVGMDQLFGFPTNSWILPANVSMII